MQNVSLGRQSPRLGFGGLDRFIFMIWNKKDREMYSIDKSTGDDRNKVVQLQYCVSQLPL